MSALTLRDVHKRFGATDVVAFGARYGLVTGAEMSDDALIRAETQKWTILNGGRQLAKVLVNGGTVTVNYDAAGAPTLIAMAATYPVRR